MKFCGETHAVIARALSLDVRTMEKHFADELENGHANRRRQVIGWMFDTAEKGNASMQKHLDALGRVSGAAEAVEGRAKPGPKLGKKEQRQAAAEQVGGKFAPPAPPKLVVSNTR